MKIILSKIGIKLSNQFLDELEKGFNQLECETYCLHSYEDINHVKNHIDKYKDACFIGFNFYNYDKDFFDKTNMPCYTILMDHPFFFESILNNLRNLPKQLYIICVDRNHEKFMKKFHPEIKSTFIPLGGTYLEQPIIKNKQYDICLTGCYRPIHYYMIEQIQDFHLRRKMLSIVEEMLANPDLLLEDEYIKYFGILKVNSELGRLNNIDTLVRHTFRARAVKTLIDNGYKVHVMGGGWKDFLCNHKENLIDVANGYTTPEACLELQANSKISLNVMPWFKDGAHDRIFSAMANGSLSLTDDSIYLKEQFKDNENIAFYSLKNLEEELLTKVDKYLSNPNELKRVTEAGRDFVLKNHTWQKRAEEILNYMQSTFI